MAEDLMDAELVGAESPHRDDSFRYFSKEPLADEALVDGAQSQRLGERIEIPLTHIHARLEEQHIRAIEARSGPHSVSTEARPSDSVSHNLNDVESQLSELFARSASRSYETRRDVGLMLSRLVTLSNSTNITHLSN
ncbi:hypothetical protein M427DRAFT_295132 [Gonapodya prolifera JEL478]|uniref:Uncharacterized protein n=1 Tax=Gonapodya prolifera (strain JEL478) TaxID=1344416 RepID=A0A139AHG1_GONPJ|nr:hypothetical protein M427DRAFT_295132 [Gonapodya prolifera JEL478]|eukprot:KXS16246.1 hypothetical protein M427DRAFT_295132 [Gonapodya prolifera JEL478]